MWALLVCTRVYNPTLCSLPKPNPNLSPNPNPNPNPNPSPNLNPNPNLSPKSNPLSLTIRHLCDVGFPNVYNENVDFYQAIRQKTIPDHDGKP